MRRPICRAVLDAHRRQAGARESEHLFFRLSDPRVIEFLERWTRETPLQPEVFNKIQEWLGDGGKRSTTGTSRGKRLTSASTCPTAPGKYFYVWLDATDRLPRSAEEALRLGAARRAYPDETRTFEQFVASPDVEQYHFIGKDIVYFHTLFWPAMLRFSERKTPTNVFVHGLPRHGVGREDVEVARARPEPAALSELGMSPDWLRYYIAPSSTIASRTSSSIPTTSSRASTATSSAST
jgi:methionyl-tRNA synthetase